VQFILLTYVFVYIMHEYNFADISAFILINEAADVDLIQMANKTKECAAALAWTQREQVVKVREGAAPP